MLPFIIPFVIGVVVGVGITIAYIVKKLREYIKKIREYFISFAEIGDIYKSGDYEVVNIGLYDDNGIKRDEVEIKGEEIDDDIYIGQKLDLR